jgi:hypothetical protein
MGDFRVYCAQCHAARKQMRRVFCWLPTRVYHMHSPFYRDGFRWFKSVWRDVDGKHYVESE